MGKITDYLNSIWKELRTFSIYIISGYLAKNLVVLISYINIPSKDASGMSMILADSIASNIIFYVFLIVGTFKFVISSYYEIKKIYTNEKNSYKAYNDTSLTAGEAVSELPGRTADIMNQTAKDLSTFSPNNQSNGVAQVVADETI